MSIRTSAAPTSRRSIVVGSRGDVADDAAYALTCMGLLGEGNRTAPSFRAGGRERAGLHGCAFRIRDAEVAYARVTRERRGRADARGRSTRPRDPAGSALGGAGSSATAPQHQTAQQEEQTGAGGQHGDAFGLQTRHGEIARRRARGRGARARSGRRARTGAAGARAVATVAEPLPLPLPDPSPPPVPGSTGAAAGTMVAERADPAAKPSADAVTSTEISGPRRRRSARTRRPWHPGSANRRGATRTPARRRRDRSPPSPAPSSRRAAPPRGSASRPPPCARDRHGVGLLGAVGGGHPDGSGVPGGTRRLGHRTRLGDLNRGILIDRDRVQFGPRRPVDATV